MRGRSVALVAALMASMLGPPAVASADTSGLHLGSGPVDGNGCHPLELMDGATLVRELPSAWSLSRCSEQRKQEVVGDLRFFDWWDPTPTADLVTGTRSVRGL